MGHASLTLQAIFLAAVKAAGGQVPSQCKAADGRAPSQCKAADGCAPSPIKAADGRPPSHCEAAEGRVVLSHFSAAVLWGLLDWDSRTPEVTVIGDGYRPHPGLRVHRSRVLPREDIRRQDRIPITSPARTLIDLAQQVEYRALRRAVRQAQSLRVVRQRDLVEAIARHSRRRGVGKLRRIVVSGPAPTRSELEDVVLELITRGGLAVPDVNVPIRVGGRRLLPDFRWPEPRLIVEADGAAWHDNPVAREDDAERQAVLEACGERVVRVTWEQAIARPNEVLARLRAAGAPSR